MLRKGMLVFVSLSAGIAGAAWAQQNGERLAGDWTSCQQMIEDCKAAPADAIFDAADLGQMGGRPIVGTCYVHTRSTCPDCFCWSYVKLSYNGPDNGWDGGTGCIQPTGSTSQDEQQSYQNAAALLKQLCESGACCCPRVATQVCPDPAPVRARDPITGSCCNFPNRCSAPLGWDIVPQGQPCPEH